MLNEEIISINTSDMRLPSNVSAFFQNSKRLFDENPNLWIKGGAARTALVHYISDRQNKFESGRFISDIPDARDIDFVYIGNASNELVNELDKIGYDTEFIGSMESYFYSRDFSLNKVLLRPDKLLTTNKAIKDIFSKKVSPTTYERNEEYGDFSPRIALRAVLLAIANGMVPTKETLRKLYKASDRLILVHLIKAFEYGIEKEFFHYIADYIGFSHNDNVYKIMLDLISNDEYFKVPENILSNIKRFFLLEKYKQYDKDV